MLSPQNPFPSLSNGDQTMIESFLYQLPFRSSQIPTYEDKTNK